MSGMTSPCVSRLCMTEGRLAFMPWLLGRDFEDARATAAAPKGAAAEHAARARVVAAARIGSTLTSLDFGRVDVGQRRDIVVLGQAPVVLQDVADAIGPQRIEVKVPARGALPVQVELTLEIEHATATAPQLFTFL